MSRTLLFLASIFLFLRLAAPLLQPVEDRFYDIWLQNDFYDVYQAKGRHPAIKLLALSEADVAERDWTPELSASLTNYLLSNQAAAVAFFSDTYTDLPQLPGVFDVPTKAEQDSIRIGSGGICRDVALAKKTPEGLQPTLPIELLARLEGVALGEVEFGERTVKVGQRTIRTGPDYRLRVRFRTSEELIDTEHAVEHDINRTMVVDTLAARSLDSFWDTREDVQEYIPGSAFLVGTLLKEARDRVQTPMGPLPGFKVHACALETLLTGWTLHELDPLEQIALEMVLLLTCFVVFVRLPVQGIIVAWGVGETLAFFVVNKLFAHGIYLKFTPILVIGTLVAVVIGAIQLRDAQEALRRFGGLGALEAAQRGDASVFEEVREKTATIVFTNVLKYLKELERYGAPDDFFARRQAYAQLLADVFRSHGGVVLDYQGDFQMLGFNVELRSDDEDHAVNAVRASQEFLARIHEVTDEWWEADEGELGTARCGICTGPVACGHVGSQRGDGGRIAQAAIGNTSNVAARLLGAAMKKDLDIIMARTTFDAADGRIEVEELEAVPLKGKTEAVPICRPVGIREDEA